jgi:hypothetical protein
MAMTVIGVYWDDLSKCFIPLTRMNDGHMGIDDCRLSIDDLEEKNRESIYAAPGSVAPISNGHSSYEPAALVGVKVAAVFWGENSL